MRAAIYCRVSTEDQQREGTSLESQLEACQRKATTEALLVDESDVYIETYSGLSLSRPALDRLRERIRTREIDVLIAYTLDRLSRDPVHYIIITEEIERHNARLALVTEDVDSSDLGRLIAYIKGYAAKIEAEKIRERTMRGKRTRAEKYGKMPTGRGVLYGYDYDVETGRNKANADIENVRMAGLWILEAHVSLNEVCRRFNNMGLLAPRGGHVWRRSTVGRIMRNPAYAGQTMAFRTKTISGKRVHVKEEDMVPIPDAVDVPAFTPDEWAAIQTQLDRNRELSPPEPEAHIPASRPRVLRARWKEVSRDTWAWQEVLPLRW